MERCSTSSVIREIQIKTTLRCHLTLTRMAVIKKTDDKECWHRYGEIRALIHWWECKMVQWLWKTVWHFLKQLNIELSYNLCIFYSYM